MINKKGLNVITNNYKLYADDNNNKYECRSFMKIVEAISFGRVFFSRSCPTMSTNIDGVIVSAHQENGFISDKDKIYLDSLNLIVPTGNGMEVEVYTDNFESLSEEIIAKAYATPFYNIKNNIIIDPTMLLSAQVVF